MSAIPDLFATQAMYDSQFIKSKSDMSGPIGLEVQHPETEYRLKKVSEKFIESIHLMVNEPSVGLYRIQEHVRRSLPQLVDKKMELRSCQNQINGVCYDLDYSIKTVQSMQHIPHFTIIQECLRSAIASKKNLDAAKLERRSKKVDEGSGAQSADAVSEVSIETQDVEIAYEEDDEGVESHAACVTRQ